MTDQFPTPAPQPSPEEPLSQKELNRRAREAKATAKSNRSWPARHKFITGVGALAVIGGGIAVTSGGGDDTSVPETPVAAVAGAEAQTDDLVGADDAVEVADTVEEDVSDGATVAQQNALESAESYLEYSGFSKAGLMDQLTSEYGDGYEKADAEWAVEHVDADWKAEAVESAESYLEYDSFSRAGLVDQLTSEYGEQYTTKQAEYAADQVGL